jgi:hypothetical protein
MRNTDQIKNDYSEDTCIILDSKQGLVILSFVTKFSHYGLWQAKSNKWTVSKGLMKDLQLSQFGQAAQI